MLPTVTATISRMVSFCPVRAGRTTPSSVRQISPLRACHVVAQVVQRNPAIVPVPAFTKVASGMN